MIINHSTPSVLCFDKQQEINAGSRLLAGSQLASTTAIEKCSMAPPTHQDVSSRIVGKAQGKKKVVTPPNVNEVRTLHAYKPQLKGKEKFNL